MVTVTVNHGCVVNHGHMGNVTDERGGGTLTINNVDVLDLELISSVEDPSFVQCLLHQCTSTDKVALV